METVGYQAVIRIKRQGEIVHHKSKTFWKHHSAVYWVKHRVFELLDPRYWRAQAASKTLGEFIRWYIAQFQALSRWQRTKQKTLEFLAQHKIG